MAGRVSSTFTRKPGRPHAVDERVEVGQSGLRRIRVPSLCPPAKGRRPGLRAVRAVSRPESLLTVSPQSRGLRSLSSQIAVTSSPSRRPALERRARGGRSCCGQSDGGGWMRPSRNTPSMRRMSVSASRPVPETSPITSAARAGSVRRGGSGGAVGQGHHHLDVVRDDVVHLPRDPGPLLDCGQRRQLVALSFEPLGPIGQPVELAAHRAHDHARSAGPSKPTHVTNTSDLKSLPTGRQRTVAMTIPASRTAAHEDPRPGRDRRDGVDGDQERDVRGKRPRDEPLREGDHRDHEEDRDGRAATKHQRERDRGRRTTDRSPARPRRAPTRRRPRRWPWRAPDRRRWRSGPRGSKSPSNRRHPPSSRRSGSARSAPAGSGRGSVWQWTAR